MRVQGWRAPPPPLSEGSSRVSGFAIPSAVTGRVGSSGELLVVALLCRCFCLGSFEFKCKFWKTWVAVYSGLAFVLVGTGHGVRGVQWLGRMLFDRDS